MTSSLHWTWLLLCLCATIAVNNHNKHKRIIHLAAEPDVFTHQYGVELPSFAYDSSEYFISAMVERATDSYSLHLTMFVLGHNTIATDLPFESISTEEEIIYKWGHALKMFKPYRNVTASHSSGLMCVIKNNDPKFPTPYHVPAFWVPTDSLPSEFKGNLEILRCQLKDVVSVYHKLAASDASMYVDIVRKGPHHNKDMVQSSGSLTHPPTHSLTHSSDNGTFVHDQSSAIISFSVPWSSRYNGYGMRMNSNYSAHDPWVSHRPHQPLDKSNLVERVYSQKANSPIIYACAASSKVIDSKYSLLSTRAFIESILESGINHVFLGVLLDIRSNRMTLYKKYFDGYIMSGRLSIVPLALEGFDNVAGFDGLHVHEKYGNWLFHNQCLYFTKGVADFTIIYEPDEHLISASSLRDGLLRSYYPRYFGDRNSTTPSLRHRVAIGPDSNPCYLKFGSIGITNERKLVQLVTSSVLLQTSKVWITTKNMASCHPSGHRIISYNASHVDVRLSEAAVYRSGHYPVTDISQEFLNNAANRYKSLIQEIGSRNADVTDSFSPASDSRVVIGSNSTMKSPFWQNCDVNHLDNVLRRVFNL